MNEVGTRSKTRMAMIVVGAIVVVAIVGGVTYAVILASQPKKTTPTPAKESPKTISASDLQLGLTNLNATTTQEKANLSKAQAALNDSQKRVKLSN